MYTNHTFIVTRLIYHKINLMPHDIGCLYTKCLILSHGNFSVRNSSPKGKAYKVIPNELGL